MKPDRSQEEKAPVELIDEAFHLLRRTSAPAVAAYCVGTLPFVLALLYFWSDMARSAFASERLLAGTFGLSLLFLWMKTWQAIFVAHLLSHLCGEETPRLELRGFLRTALYQTILQPLGLFLLPLSLLLLAPTGWVYAYFANATLFSNTAPDLRTLHRQSWEQAKLWAVQSHVTLFLFKLFGLVVFINVMLALAGGPWLLKMLLGIETVFSRSPIAMMNTTVLAGAACVTFLCIDPVLKAVYTLRCFYGQSLVTGQDLKAELRTFSNSRPLVTVAALFFLLNVASPGIFAAEQLERGPTSSAPRNEAVSPSALDRTIDEVIQRREYSWRLPRETNDDQARLKADNFVVRFSKGIRNVVRDFAEWLSRRSGQPNIPSTDGLNVAGAIRGLIYVLLAGIIVGLGWWLFRLWKKAESAPEVEAQASLSPPNVADENVGAEELPEDGWMKMAADLLDRGELRLALRAFYLATLAHLAERNLISLARCKSNRDYERELSRRGHALGGVPALFSQSVMTFERVWYGPHNVTREMLAEFAQKTNELKSAS